MELSMKQRYARLDLSKLPKEYTDQFKVIAENTDNFEDSDLVEIFTENFNDLYSLVESRFPEAVRTGGTIKKEKPAKMKVIRKKKGIFQRKEEKEALEPLRIEKEFEDYEKKQKTGLKQKYEYKGYAKMISEATGVTNKEDLAYIEDIMRHEIFHSTLDWQTKEEFDKAAREARDLMPEMKKVDAEIGIEDYGKKLLYGSGPRKLSASDIEFIEDQLTNNEDASDEELITHLVVELGITEAQAKKWVAKRDKYLKEPVEKRIKYSERTKLKKEARAESQTVTTRDGFKVKRKGPLNRGKAFYDENGKKWTCKGYSAKLDECIFTDDDGKEISSCLKDMYKNNPVEKRSKGDLVDECRETLKEAGYTVHEHKAGKKTIRRSKPRPEKEIIKERVSDAFTPITKDLDSSDEKKIENKEVIEVLNDIQGLFTKFMNRISNLADDGKIEKLKKIKQLLNEIVD